MPSRTRRIHHLRLRGQRRQDVNSILFPLEDGMRTASLPGIPGHGLTIIRKLDLGPLSARISSPALSARIDQQTISLLPEMISSAAPDRPGAGAVWFADELQPWKLLAEMLGRGGRPTAWYWPRAVPGWQENMSRRQGLRVVMKNVFTAENRRIASAALLDHLVRAGGIDSLLEVVGEEDVAGNFSVSRVEEYEDDLAFEPREQELLFSSLPADWKKTMARWPAAWGQHDLRSFWLAESCLMSRRLAARPLLVQSLVRFFSPGREKQHSIRERQESRPRKTIGREKVLSEETGVNVGAHSFSGPASEQQKLISGKPGRTTAASTGAVGLPPEDSRQHAAASPAALSEVPGLSADKTADAVPPLSAAGQAASLPGSEPMAWQGVFTSGAGLLFLIPVLETLGITALLAEYPLLAAANLPAVFFRLCARQLELEEDDPFYDLFPRQAAERLYSGRSLEFSPPSLWQELWAENLDFSPAERPAARLVAARGRQGVSCREVAAALLLAVELFLCLRLEIGLPELALRPGRISFTPTHVDILFNIEQADIRIRKAGLDIDPGWVEWLGLVVNYHYRYGEI